MNLRAATLVLCAVAPTLSVASSVDTMGSFGLLDTLVTSLARAAGFIRFAMPFLPVAAAYLFWKKSRGGWHFSCVVVPAMVNLIFGLVSTFSRETQYSVQATVFMLLLTIAVYIFLLAVAVRVVAIPKSDAARSLQRTDTPRRAPHGKRQLHMSNDSLQLAVDVRLPGHSSPRAGPRGSKVFVASVVREAVRVGHAK